MKGKIQTMTTFLEKIKHKILLFRDNKLYVWLPILEYIHEVYIKGRHRSYYSKSKRRWMYESGDNKVIFTVPIKRLTKEERIKYYEEFQVSGVLPSLHEKFIDKNKDVLESLNDK